MPRFVHGWKPDRIDPRDLLYRKVAKPRMEPLPDFVDLRAGMPPVQDQGELGSCTAHALAGAVEYLELKAGLDLTRLSRLFIYWNERKIENTVNEDSGAQIRDGIKSLNLHGVCPEDNWPYLIDRFTEPPGPDCYIEARPYVIDSYHRLLNLSEMMDCLAEGYPFVFGFSVFSGFQSEKARLTGIIDMPTPYEHSLGGHAVLAVGYDRDSRCFLVRNSWGPEWGEGGYFRLPFDYVEALADDFWMIKTY